MCHQSFWSIETRIAFPPMLLQSPGLALPSGFYAHISWQAFPIVLHWSRDANTVTILVNAILKCPPFAQDCEVPLLLVPPFLAKREDFSFGQRGHDKIALTDPCIYLTRCQDSCYVNRKLAGEVACPVVGSLAEDNVLIGLRRIRAEPITQGSTDQTGVLMAGLNRGDGPLRVVEHRALAPYLREKQRGGHHDA